VVRTTNVHNMSQTSTSLSAAVSPGDAWDGRRLVNRVGVELRNQLQVLAGEPVSEVVEAAQSIGRVEANVDALLEAKLVGSKERSHAIPVTGEERTARLNPAFIKALVHAVLVDVVSVEFLTKASGWATADTAEPRTA